MPQTKEVKYGASKVSLNQRKDGRFVLRWRESNQWRRTTAKDKSRAQEKALILAKRLDSNDGLTRVSMEESRAVELLKQNLGKRNLVDVVSGLSSLLKVLPDSVALSDIAKEWESKSAIFPIKVEEWKCPPESLK